MAISSRVTKKVASPVTKRNPRPRKYASQAERQAAYRARNVMLEFRAEPKTADNVTKIAETLGYPRSDVLLSMVKFALTNHDWARFGLTHKTIPAYKENPTMKPATPAQLAARKRFAEMARSGAFKKASKRKANPTIQYIVFSELSPQKYKQMLVTENKQRAISVANVKQMDGYHSVVEDQVGHLIYDAKTRQGYLQSNPSKRKANPITETVIWGLAPGETRDYMEEIMYGGGQKLTKEQVDKVIAAATKAGYHSFRVSGIDMTKAPDFVGALNIGRKRRTNPMQKYTVLHRGTANIAGEVMATGPQAAKKKIAEKLGIPTLAYLVAKKTNPAKKTVSQKISQLRHEGYPQRQAVAVALSEQRTGKVKRNPSGLYAMKTQYLVSCPSTKKNMGFFDKQSDAKIYAQELADKHGTQYAIKAVKVPKIQAVHFVVGESTKSFKA